ncbi:MAG TPA: cell division protein FtsZ, partial [Bacteroidetes bacterium]|nr:cell division protein FtsZ [Bacteroidota bacterium]
MQFDIPNEKSSIIKVVGVGGGGGNAVNHMYRQGIVGVDFVICNTDQQALDMSPVPFKIQLGQSISQGRGAGMNPEVGKRSTIEALDEIMTVLEDGTKMIFITAGMGKGTGTGGAPVIAKAAREKGILTVGLVTTPFLAEGPRRIAQANEGISELQKYVDTLLVISNDKMREVYGNLKLSAAFAHADSVLANAARSIAEIITVPGYVNVDFEDVNTVMRQSGVAIMGTSIGEGENRAQEAIEDALNSPLLNDNDIRGAKNILLNVTSGEDEVTLDEITSITDYIQTQAGFDTNIIWGNCNNPSLGNKIAVTVIATGFESKGFFKNAPAQKKTTLPLEDKNEVQYNSDGAIIEINKPEQMPPAAVEESEKEIVFELAPENPSAENLNEPAMASSENLEEQFRLIEKEPKSEIHEVKNMNDLNAEENRRRIEKLRSMSSHQSTESTGDLEKEPAYKRRNMNLKDTPHSSESNISTFYL